MGKRLKIIGTMTGNSMDAMDVVLTEFNGDWMRDICSWSMDYSKEFQYDIEFLRQSVHDKMPAEILKMPEFHKIHDMYIKYMATAIKDMCQRYNIDTTKIDAIGFHGKTLDHNPPSVARLNNTLPYTLQMGSGQMLSNMTNIPVVYDFRSAPIMNGSEAAPLIPEHNAHIAKIEGDGIYYNGGNTSNFAMIQDGVALFGTDVGPCNEYIDNYIRNNSNMSFDKDGLYGKRGKLNINLLYQLFNVGRQFYELRPPKSGDPQYYRKNEIFQLIQQQKSDFYDTVYTLEYFAAYIAVLGLRFIGQEKIPNNFILFGGGWKNPIIRHSFDALLRGDSYVLPQHKKDFDSIQQRLKGVPVIKYSRFGKMMEPRLFADMARYKIENKAWPIPGSKNVVCGRTAYPQATNMYTDKINIAAKGWQERVKQ